MGRFGGWSALTGQHWPVALVVVSAFTAEAMTLVGGPGELSAWQLPFAAALGAAAVAATRYPVAMACGSAVLLVGETVLAALVAEPGPRLFGGIAMTAMAGLCVTLLACVRYAPRRRAVPTAVGLAAAVLVASNLRPVFQVTTAEGGLESQPLLLLGIAAAGGLFLRQRDHVRARDVRVLVEGARQSERLTLARELHDLVAYHLTGIIVQAKAAKRASSPDVAQRVMPDIEAAGSEAMTAMRRLVHTLRHIDDAQRGVGDTTGEAQPTGDLDADLRSLAAGYRLPVVVAVDGVGGLAPDIAGSVLRIVRESLTNVGKHAQAPSRVDVEVTGDERSLSLSVRDNGVRSSAAKDPGYGLIGMRERAQLLGGRLRAGPAGRGWEVRAEIPLVGRNGRGDR
ncbi:sensor histidine kinase [Saccharothrix algeriensis]|uniref:histidine kinase n=1 Tax=Saccharothrix algeriensis TaxID=173560 RepID=A0ABS2S2N3_9PSEU|nr:histidine kinase [Saccharothrix algeriensis]MBM7810489.1 signal transduction histidine kinase [Saccharothrix algeriensis]